MTEDAKTAERQTPRPPVKPAATPSPAMPKPGVEARATVPARIPEQPKPEPAIPTTEVQESTPKAQLPVPSERKRPVKDWQPMETAAKDGKPIWVTDGNGSFIEAVWRSTRRVAPLKGRWVEYGFWAILNGGGQKIPWEPKGWLPTTGMWQP
jgi:hypothetical protein